MKFEACFTKLGDERGGYIVLDDERYEVTAWAGDRITGAPAVHGSIINRGQPQRFRIEMRTAEWPATGFMLLGEPPYIVIDLQDVTKAGALLRGTATDQWLDNFVGAKARYTEG